MMTPPISLDLHNYRIESLFSFKATGLDQAGPLYVRIPDEDTVLKVYILLLTFSSSRGIHLELTSDVKFPSFIRGFKRFMSRRDILDVSVNKNFKTFQSIEVKRFILQQIIQKFILPASSWRGERARWGDFMNGLSGL